MEDNYEVSVEEQEGVNEPDVADQETETTEAESAETDVQNDGAVEPEAQTAEENSRYAAIRRKAEEDAKRKYEAEMGNLNQQISAMCRGITHPLTGQPITNVREYVSALQAQQRQANEQVLEEKGIDPAMIDRMIESNPVVMQAKQVMQSAQEAQAGAALQRDLEELSRIDPSIKGIQDLANLPNFPQMLDYVARYEGMSIVDAYKVFNYGNTQNAARQQAINQMRGKGHLATQTNGVTQDDEYVEVPAEIMSRWKESGKTEKQIRELYKKVAGKLHI